MGNGLCACMHSFILREKKSYVSVKKQVMDCRKNVLLARKLGDGKETKGTVMEIFQAWIRLLNNEDPAGNSDKGAGCLLKSYSCKLPMVLLARPLKPPDQAGPKGQQPLSNSDAEASEKKVIRKFLYKY